jgi:hypothetical protein
MQTLREHEFAMQVMSLGLGFQVWQSRNEISTSQHPWCVHRVVIQLGHLEVNDPTETAWRRPMRWRAFSPRDFGHFHGQRKGRNPTGNANWVRFKTIHIWCIYINLKYGWLKTIDDKFCAGPLAPKPRRPGSTNEFFRPAERRPITPITQIWIGLWRRNRTGCRTWGSFE